MEPETRPPVISGEGVKWFQDGLSASWKKGFIFVAELDGEPAGFTIAGPANDVREPRTRAPNPVRRVGEIYELHVVKRHRRKGVGTALMKTAERVLARRGFTEVILSHLARNAPAAQLYDSRGYRERRVSRVKKVKPRPNRV
jgi:GNAT superfamily N-acetyltransferase